MEFGKRHNATDTTDFCPRQLVTDLIRGNWCDGFFPLPGSPIQPVSPLLCVTVTNVSYRNLLTTSSSSCRAQLNTWYLLQLGVSKGY